MILGIDEVGRGPWAGPLVVGAVVLGEEPIDGLTDSKKLSKRRREELAALIRERANGYALGWVDANELDQIGMSQALVLATKRAVAGVQTPYHEIIIDGTVNFLKDTTKGRYVTTLKKADLLIPSVSAASIIAKVARDDYMTGQDTWYPGYNFKAHAGYGTAQHRAAITSLGVTPLHRLSFAPLSGYATNTTPNEQSRRLRHMTSKQLGDTGETVAVSYLMDHGHKILERNWRTRLCEIDIVSRAGTTIFFTEVKYRKDDRQGGGLAAITNRKQKQMVFAADVFAAARSLGGMDRRLCAMEVTGNPPVVSEYLELG